MAACAWYSPSRSWARAACRISTASAIDVGVPPAAVLLGERHQAAVGRGPGRAPGVVEQHQGQQPRHLGVVDRGAELPGESDGLDGEVDVAGVALVEDQVEDAEHGRDVAGLVEPHPGDGALGPADALRHGRLGHQVGLGDLAGGQPAHRAERERDRGRRGQRRVGAQEVELERVVHRGCGPGHRLLVDDVLAPATGGVRPGRVQEPTPGDGDQPALRVPRRVRRPHADRLDQCVLDGVLGRREVGSAADEDAEHARREAPEQDLVHRRGHSVMVGGSVRNGRTSSHSWIGSPPAPGAADSSPGQLEGAVVAVDVDHHPAGDEVLGLGERTVGDRRAALAVVPDERPLGRERLTVDELAGPLEPDREVVHVLDVGRDLLRRPPRPSVRR